MYLEDMADVLRAGGVTVVELDGWQRRARSTGGYDPAPACVMLHHTASAGDGAADAHYCTYTDDDRPVCNLVIGRDGVVHVCAGGATNCNGKGGPYALADGTVIPTDQMNLWAIAVELSNSGIGQPYPTAQVDAMFATLIALAGAYLGGRVDLCAQHVDWSPGRKIDPATATAVDGAWQPASINTSGSWRLADVIEEARQRQGAPDPEPPEVDMPGLWIARAEGTGVVWLGNGVDARRGLNPSEFTHICATMRPIDYLTGCVVTEPAQVSVVPDDWIPSLGADQV